MAMQRLLSGLASWPRRYTYGRAPHIAGATLLALVLLALISAYVLVTARTDAQAADVCVGDCNHNNSVTVDEILTMVNIVFSPANFNACTAGDTNNDFTITVDEVLTAVNNALSNCSSPTPTPEFATGASQAAILAPSTINQAIGIVDFGYIGASGGAAAQTNHVSLRMVREAALVPRTDAPAVGGAQAVEQCPLDGFRDISCDIDFNGNYVLSAFFTGCTFENSSGTQIILDGAFQQSTADPIICSGATPGSIPATTSLMNFTQEATDSSGTVTIISAGFGSVFSDTVIPMGDGCNGPNSTEALDGDLSVEVDSAAGVLLSAKDLTLSNLTVVSSSSGAPCQSAAVIDGDLDVFDGVTFDDLLLSFNTFAIATTAQSDGSYLLTLQGNISSSTGACFGDAHIDTLQALRFNSLDALCPSAGALQVTIPNNPAVTVRYSPQGIDFNNDGVPDVSSCLDSSLKQCPGECAVCTTDDECPGNLICEPCSQDCAQTTPMRCAPTDFLAQCQDGKF